MLTHSNTPIAAGSAADFAAYMRSKDRFAKRAAVLGVRLNGTRTPRHNKNGVILYEGPSTLDGSPIVVIATGLDDASANNKTGAMIQTWILRADMTPLQAVAFGLDDAICGECPHRGLNGDKRTCYVTLFQAPLNVYKTYTRGRYAKASAAEASKIFAGKRVRLGSYGDPGAVPVSIWRAVTQRAVGWTGYTHQWRRRPSLRPYCMASCDSAAESVEAARKGWRFFRVGSVASVALSGETLCPASEEAGRRTTCERCGLCAGTTSTSRKSIMIPAHGASKAKVNG